MIASTNGRTSRNARPVNAVDVTLVVACVVWVVMTLWSGKHTGGAGLPVIPQTITSLDLSWADAAPIVVLGSYAFALFLNPVNKSVGSVTFFMFGFSWLLALYRCVVFVLEQNTSRAALQASLQGPR